MHTATADGYDDDGLVDTDGDGICATSCDIVQVVQMQQHS